MGVVHLARPTRFPRVNMSAANLVCAAYPDNEAAHKLIWSLVSKSQRILSVNALKAAVDHILKTQNL